MLFALTNEFSAFEIGGEANNIEGAIRSLSHFFLALYAILKIPVLNPEIL